jgi:hypothetical protein
VSRFRSIREQALDRLRQLAEDSKSGGDKEAIHAEADEILLELVGDPKVIEAFEAIEKWYS